MDISVKTIPIERRGNDGLICADNIRADIQVTFYVQVNRKEEDVLTVAQRVGCGRASDLGTLRELYAAKFSEALKTVGKRMEFEQLYTHRTQFKDAIIEVVGRDLDGYVLADCAIDYLEQTPIQQLDPNNILDAQGIRKITEITAGQTIKTNDLRQEERKAIAKQNLEADEAVLELEKRKAEAVARQQREVATIQARERAETEQVEAEQRRIAELARLKAEEDVQVAEEAKNRQIEVAAKDRERVLAIKEEQVIKDRDLERLGRERQVELQRIEKDKALEAQKKEIADIVRARIVVDKTVAEEEERIKDIRVAAEATRSKTVVVTAAQARAEESGIALVAGAQAQEKAAEHEAKQRLTVASAALEAADKEAKAKIRLAEAVQAEAAAEGLARARVQEAEATALQKTAQAEAVVVGEKMKAAAAGEAAQGEVRLKLKDQEIALTEKEGLVKARVGEAEAGVVKQRGVAEAEALAQRLIAEARGVAEKATALQAMQGAAKEHEEFRLRVELEKAVALAQVEAQKALALAQGEVLSKALGTANIQLIGGDAGIFEQIARSLAVGKSVDGAVAQSDVLKKLLTPYLEGDRSLAYDAAALTAGLASGGAKDIAATAALTRLATKT
jgi:uncharacterized membrane protein YqiK